MSNWQMLLIMLGVPLFHRMQVGEYMFRDMITGEPVYRCYDPRDGKTYMATGPRSRFRVALDELEYRGDRT